VRERVFPVGRLDYESEGLVILTNDGDYAQSVNHPKKDLKKTYEVKVQGTPPPEVIQRLKAGVTLAEGRCRALYIERMPSEGKHSWFRVTLVEGRNQQLKRMFFKVGFDVLKVKRIAVGKLFLGKLERGGFRFLTLDQAKSALR
jgi:23S rRNA pseudouridine2605 synthase